MNTEFKFYSRIFEKSLEGLDKNMLAQKRLEASVGIVLNSTYLKLYKREWTNDYHSPLNAEARIFFSIWLNDKTIKEKKLFYNIHALKLRKLKGYNIASREFATRFRKHFKPYQSSWENVNVTSDR